MPTSVPPATTGTPLNERSRSRRTTTRMGVAASTVTGSGVIALRPLVLTPVRLEVAPREDSNQHAPLDDRQLARPDRLHQLEGLGQAVLGRHGRELRP